MSVATTNSSKAKVRNFWQAASCGETLYLAGDSHDAYAKQAQIRYQLEPYIQTFAEFEKYKNKSVLEIGVGLGADHEQFARAGATMTGVDLTSRAIEHVKTRFDSLGLKSNLLEMDAEKLAFTDNSFDLVYSWGVLHHTPDTPQAIAEVHRVLKPGGEARIMIYHTWSMIGLMLWARYGLLRGRPFISWAELYSNHLESPGTKAYTIKEARKLFERFSSVNITTQLSHGDLLTSNAGQRHRGLLLTIAKKLWPTKLIQTFLPRAGLFMMIHAVK